MIPGIVAGQMRSTGATDSLIISKSKATAAATTALNVPAPAGIQDGDLLIGFAFHSSNLRTLSPPSGWASNQYVSLTYNGIMVASKIASSEPASHTWSLSGSDNISVIVVCLRGPSALSVAAGTVARSAVGETSKAAPGLTSALSGVLFGFSGCESTSARTCTAPGMVALDEHSVGGRNAALFYEEPNSSGATGDREVTWSAAVTGTPRLLVKAGY